MLTQKKQKFVNSWIETGSKTEGYEMAFDVTKMQKATVHKRASELSKSEEVAEYYNHMMLVAQERTQTTVAKADEMLKGAYDKARNLDQPAAMVAAVNGLIKLHGLAIEKGGIEPVTITQNILIADRRDLPPSPLDLS